MNAFPALPFLPVSPRPDAFRAAMFNEDDWFSDAPPGKWRPDGQGHLPFDEYENEKNQRRRGEVRVVFQKYTKKDAAEVRPDNLNEKGEREGGRLIATTGGMEVGSINFDVDRESGVVKIGTIWLPKRARGWGIGQQLYKAMYQTIRREFPYIDQIESDVYTQDGLKTQVRSLGKPSAMYGSDGESYDSSPEGMQGAHRSLPTADNAWFGGMLISKDNVNVMHRVPQPRGKREFYPKDFDFAGGEKAPASEDADMPRDASTAARLRLADTTENKRKTRARPAKNTEPVDPYGSGKRLDRLYDPVGRGVLPLDSDSDGDNAPRMKRLTDDDLDFSYFDDPDPDAYSGMFFHEIKARVHSRKGKPREVAELLFQYDDEEEAVAVTMVWVAPEYRRFGLANLMLHKMRERVSKIYPHAKIFFGDLHSREMLRTRRKFQESVGAGAPTEIEAYLGDNPVDHLPASPNAALDWAEQYLPPSSGPTSNFDEDGNFNLPEPFRRHVNLSVPFPHLPPPAKPAPLPEDPNQLKLFAARLDRWRIAARNLDRAGRIAEAEKLDARIRSGAARLAQWAGPNNANTPIDNRVIPWKEMAGEMDDVNLERQKQPRHRTPDLRYPTDLPTTGEEQENLFNMHGEGGGPGGFAYIEPSVTTDGGASNEAEKASTSPFGKYKPH